MKHRLVGALAVVATALTIASCSNTPTTETATPTATATATATVSATPSPTRSATPEPEEPWSFERVASIDDETILARITTPRTGEVWHAPEPYTPETQLFLPEVEGDRFEYFAVGERGNAVIVFAVDVADPLFNGVRYIPAIFEVDANGPRAIACPSAIKSDPCAILDYLLPDSVPIDTDTFYDSLTLPSEIPVMDGVTVLIKETRLTTLTWDVYGQGQLMTPPETGADALWPWRVTQEVWRHGALSLVEVEKASLIDGMPSVTYAIVTPVGTMVWLENSDLPGGNYERITWDDGVARPYGPEWGGVGPVMAPADQTCFGGPFTRDSNHVDADWVKAGVTGEGFDVFVPKPGGSDLSLKLWTTLAENSAPIEVDGRMVSGVDSYTYKTHEDFLAASALITMQWPNGVWVLAARYDAASTVWECA